MRRERNGRNALPGCFASVSALEHGARAIVAQRGESPKSAAASDAHGDQQLGSVVQILPDLATAAAMALADAVALLERTRRTDAHPDHHQRKQSFSPIFEQFACLWTRTCLPPKKADFSAN
jgi:hypothetical protein